VRAVGAGSSWVVVGNGGAVRVRPARTVDGRPEDGPPGHPRRPVSAGKQSGGSATENPTPAAAGCPRRGSAREGDHTREGQPAGGAGSGRRGRLAHDASPEALVGPPRRPTSSGRAVRLRRAGRGDLLPGPAPSVPGGEEVLPPAGREHRQLAERPGPRPRPAASAGTTARTPVLSGQPARTTQGPPSGGGRPLRVVRGGASPGGCRVVGHLTRDVPGVENAGRWVT
jgi:hypothetical protein